ncbi:DUF4097 family beta strand repeat-containing protein [Muricauda sp. 2012CJ35-5]|uniref:DUF4097 family beta strand repeat-containing protein n=1 Tax=Flagellimonas spongiicola TaxID=2942208 RepID=A0ABT0PTV7_9FLAO|nr:DUF4097 family beta strand repeat-containing protein [Allomuricauda spongiicola]MCL6274823.1 DUF4097 family beta strand repeat-containing protein [Allomuricauda spongiicola]
MRNNRKISLTIALYCMAIISSTAQETDLFTVPLSDPGAPGKLIVEQVSGSITVQGYSGSEVTVQASFDDGKSRHKEKTKNGMRKIGNSSLSISAEEKNNVVTIDNDQVNKTTNLIVKVPRNFALHLSTINHGNIEVSNVNGEMEISNVNGAITLDNISGSATTDTVNGDIKVTFESITSDAPMGFSSLNGDLDITFPSSLKANVKAKTDMGDILTDFDMVVMENVPEVNKNSESGTYKVQLEQWVRGKINGGGPEMLFKTFNGDIMIKSK